MSETCTNNDRYIIEKITYENVDDYDMIPPEVAENADRDHHKGLAVLDKESGELLAIFMCAMTGAGWDGNVKALVIEWFYAADEASFKELLDIIIKEAVEEKVKKLRMELPEYEEEKKEMLLHNGFTGESRESLIVETNIDEISRIKQFQGEVLGDVIPLDDLLVREYRRALTNFIFHGARGLLEDAESLPMSWFDLELSCCIRTGDRITGMLLVKRTVTDILVPVLMFAFNPDAAIKLMMLLRFFVQNAEEKLAGDTKVMICRFNQNVRALTDKLLPDRKGKDVYFFERDI